MCKEKDQKYKSMKYFLKVRVRYIVYIIFCVLFGVSTFSMDETQQTWQASGQHEVIPHQLLLRLLTRLLYSQVVIKVVFSHRL